MHSQQLRGLARRRTGPAGSISQDVWPPTVSRGIWQQGFPSNRFPSIGNRFYEVEDEPLQRSWSSDDISQHSPFLSSPKPWANQSVGRIPFETAAWELFEALEQTRGNFEHCHNQFKEETRGVQFWAPPDVIDKLWAMKMDWNGVPAFEAARDPNLKPKDEAVYYKKYARQLLRAWEGMKSCGPLPFDLLQNPGSKLGPVEVRTAMKKLEATFQGIEELMQLVRTDRNRAHALSDQLTDARRCLTDIEELWTTTRKST